jgi:hypothetical protein
VAREQLVAANAVSPTAGTAAFVMGLGAGGALRAAGDSAGVDGDLTVLVTAAAAYGVAGLLALRIPRDLLGPDPDPRQPGMRDAVRDVLAGLRDGLGHLGERRGPAAGLAVIASHRYWFGIASVVLVLLVRNHLHDPSERDAAFADLSLVALVSGAGFLTAAVVTPSVVSRIGTRRWVLGLLGTAALVQLYPGGLATLPALSVTGFVLGLVSQGVKICVDTIVQAGIDDVFRGRVFSLYDVVFNVAFVAAAATAAVVLPADGRSPPVVAAMSLGYLATALGYARATRVT